jgi:polyphenol oxidase
MYVHPEWAVDWPWLLQGTTGSGIDGSYDLGLSGAEPVGEVLRHWRRLAEWAGTGTVAHSRQVHGNRVLEHGDGSPGLAISDGFDGHATDRPGVLLTVSVADCVPISLVDHARRRIALLHGGWRGTARGILARGLAQLGSDPASVRMHLGPAICGLCYEVGPEVHEALGLPVPPGPQTVDVRAVLTRQALAVGLLPEHVTVSEHCTLCGEGFFSHRAGSAGRQIGFLGIRP